MFFTQISLIFCHPDVTIMDSVRLKRNTENVRSEIQDFLGFENTIFFGVFKLLWQNMYVFLCDVVSFPLGHKHSSYFFF